MEAKVIDTIWHWAKMFVLCTVIIIILRAFIFIPLEITGSSMAPTLDEGDYVITENITKIKRFDVVVFYAPDGNTYVKRVIGLPGEHVVYEKDKLFVDGVEIKEDFLDMSDKKKSDYSFTSDLDSKDLLGKEKIPKDQYFVMGDNRRLSKDSRTFGTISEYSITGKALVVYYPFPHMKVIKH